MGHVTGTMHESSELRVIRVARPATVASWSILNILTTHYSLSSQVSMSYLVPSTSALQSIERTDQDVLRRKSQRQRPGYVPTIVVQYVHQLIVNMALDQQHA